MTPRIRFRLASIWALSALAACGAPPAVCPDGGTTLTYENFGRGFTATYCLQCHGGDRVEKGVNLSTIALVRTHANAVESAAGPGGSMPPPESLAPSTAEREQLVQWLSCGGP